MAKINCNSLNYNKMGGTVPINGDTIAAISTPIGRSGIGIVRLSGKRALSIADKVFVSSNGLRPSQFPSHTLRYGWIKDKSGIVDEVMLTVMRAPRTYTKEDIVEVNCHSGIVVLKKTLELVLREGARLASPGEFTKRAYLNGRIDLSQAEAVLDIINSQTQEALNVALGQLRGKLSRKIKSLHRDLSDILMQLELSIDFSDQDVKPQSAKELLQKIERLWVGVKQLADSADKGAILRQGVSCVICGRTNVGKSSLLNALLQKDRAIVTSLAGTTRDSLEETLDLFGIPVRLIDTAGIIQPRDLVEKEAVKRSRQHLQQADLILFVFDASQRLTRDDLAISRLIRRKQFFAVLNKDELPNKIQLDKVEKLCAGRKILRICALYERGLDRLKKEIAEYIWQGKTDARQELLVTNIRHREALKKALTSLKRAINSLKAGQSQEIVVLDIKEAQGSLVEIIGEIGCEDVLERIFAQFCIGK